MNAVCPSYVATPMLERSLKRSPRLEKMIQQATPLSRAALPEEVADVIVFLCTPSASYINGTGIIIDSVSFEPTSANLIKVNIDHLK